MTQHRKGIRWTSLGLMAIAPILVVGSMAHATPILEDEPSPEQNDTAETAQPLDAEVTHVIGELGLLADPTEHDFREVRVLEGDRADTVTFSDLPTGDPFFAWIDNSASGIDTVLGALNEDGTILNVNDDGSPLGTGVASGVSGVVNADGTVVLRVSGFPDFDFDGQFDLDETGMGPEAMAVAEPSGGAYTLYVQSGIDELEAVDPAQADYSFEARIQTGGVDEFVVQDLPPSTPYIAWIENSESGIDTVMGAFSAEEDLLRFDDDGSPVGTGVASAIASTVGDNGEIALKVSLFPDFNFNGQYTDDDAPALPEDGTAPSALGTQPHGMQGEYDVFVKVGIDRIAGDIDFYTYSDLEPGQAFTAEVLLANFDSRLGWFDESGELVSENDDSGEGFLSRIEGTVPESGTVTLAVTGVEDVGFTGQHTVLGDYVLRLTVAQ